MKSAKLICVIIAFTLLHLSLSSAQELRLDKNSFYPGENIQVYFNALGSFESSAWVGIIPSNVAHGSEAENDKHDLTYQYLDKRTSGTLTFKAPQESGSYDLRMFDTDSNGREVASVSFVVSAQSSAQSSLVPLYRWYNSRNGDHFYTTDQSGELAPSSGYTYEGITGYIATSQKPGTAALYRWYSHTTGDHFYTTDPSGELAPSSGYTSEGITGYIATSQEPGTAALYRWYSHATGDHFYTTDPSGELAPSSGYASEGITGYLWTGTQGQSTSYPQTLHECENGGTNICGTWILQGNQYTANWENGATATLQAVSWNPSGVVITRYDAGGSSAGLSGRYEGQINGNKIENGKVTWTWNGNTWSGTWYANW